SIQGSRDAGKQRCREAEMRGSRVFLLLLANVTKVDVTGPSHTSHVVVDALATHDRIYDKQLMNTHCTITPKRV
ncbi:hypothetical protein LSAT2_026826, partial [Lamellibrachia satsuma]